MPLFSRGNYYRIISGDTVLRFNRLDETTVVQSDLVYVCIRCQMPTQGIFYTSPPDYHPAAGVSIELIERFLSEKAIDHERVDREVEKKYIGNKTLTVSGND